jgi:hypothetical protein
MFLAPAKVEVLRIFPNWGVTDYRDGNNIRRYSDEDQNCTGLSEESTEAGP